MALVQVQVFGIEEVTNLVRKVVAFAQKPEDMLDEAAALMINRTRQRFLAEEDPDGNPWIPSKSGAARKAAGGPGTLFDTGNLFRSIHAFSNSPTERAIGSDVDYAKTHQEGLEGNIQRVFLGFGTEDVGVLELLAATRLREAIEAAN